MKKSDFILRKEDSLITNCARTVISPSLAKKIRELTDESLDWEYVRQASLQHAVLPLVYRTLHEVGKESLPDTFLLDMRNHFQSTVIRNMRMAASLLKILTLFEEYGITAVPFKGPVLAEYV